MGEYIIYASKTLFGIGYTSAHFIWCVPPKLVRAPTHCRQLPIVWFVAVLLLAILQDSAPQYRLFCGGGVQFCRSNGVPHEMVCSVREPYNRPNRGCWKPCCMLQHSIRFGVDRGSCRWWWQWLYKQGGVKTPSLSSCISFHRLVAGL